MVVVVAELIKQIKLWTVLKQRKLRLVLVVVVGVVVVEVVAVSNDSQVISYGF
jgi:hypothetical protein